ncbi:hypothetical protein N7522_001503 [Penicillium canescens]|nr:hypothetical protein N7522_001503 [Penicillium canescens]
MVLLAALCLCLCLFWGLEVLRSFTLRIWLAHQHSSILPGSLLQSTHHLILKPDLVRSRHLLISRITAYMIIKKPPRCRVKGRLPETIPCAEIRPMRN